MKTILYLIRTTTDNIVNHSSETKPDRPKNQAYRSFPPYILVGCEVNGLLTTVRIIINNPSPHPLPLLAPSVSLEQKDVPFRTMSAPPSEQAQFHYGPVAWRKQTKVQMGIAPHQSPQQPQGMAGPIPGGGQLNPGPGGVAVASGMQGGPQQGQVPPPGSQQQVYLIHT